MSQIKDYTIFGRQVGYVIISNLIVLALGIIQIPIITESLGTSLYGTLSLIYNTVALIVPFSMLHFSTSIVRFLSAETDKTRIREDFFSACSIVLISGAVFSVLMLLLSELIANHIIKDINQIQYIRIGSALVFLNSLFPVLLAFFRRETNIGLFTILSTSLPVLNFGLILLFIFSGYGITGVLLATILSSLILNVVTSIIIFKKIGFQRPRFINMKPYLKWGIPLTPNIALMWLIQSSDRYLISYFLQVSAAGIYSAAYGIGSYASFASIPVGIVLYPIISRKYDEGNLEECTRYFHFSFKYLMMITIPAAAGLSVLAEPILKILTPPEFVSGSPIVIFTALSALFYCIHHLCSFVLHLVGKTKIPARLLSITAVLNIIINIILIPQLGIIGSGIASVISSIVLSLLTLFITRRYLKFNLSLLFLMKSLVASAIMALCIWPLHPESLIMVIVSILIGIVIYFGILIIIRGFNQAELSFFSSFIRKNIIWRK